MTRMTGKVAPDRPKVIGKNRLLTVKAAGWVLGQGPLRFGRDNQLWAYDSGVYVPGEGIFHKRCARLFDDRFRQVQRSNTREMVRAMAGRIDCDPLQHLINFQNGLLSWRTVTR